MGRLLGQQLYERTVMLLFDFVERGRMCFQESIAVHNVAEGVSLSYQQLHAQVLQLAASLSHLLKIREESELPSALEIPRIVVLSSNSSKDVVLLLACAYLGVPFSPIHESFSEAELLQMILVLQPTVRAKTLGLDVHLPLFPH